MVKEWPIYFGDTLMKHDKIPEIASLMKSKYMTI